MDSSNVPPNRDCLNHSGFPVKNNNTESTQTQANKTSLGTRIIFLNVYLFFSLRLSASALSDRAQGARRDASAAGRGGLRSQRRNSARDRDGRAPVDGRRAAARRRFERCDSVAVAGRRRQGEWRRQCAAGHVSVRWVNRLAFQMVVVLISDSLIFIRQNQLLIMH